LDYCCIDDFRDIAILSKEIIEHNLNNVNQNENMVIAANSPAYGTAIGMLIAKNYQRIVVLISVMSIPTQLPIRYSGFIIRKE
jgi:hypothetical protein